MRPTVTGALVLLLAACSPPVGRYQFAVSDDGGIIHRLDTTTGDMQAFSLGNPRSMITPKEMAYYPLASVQAPPEEVRRVLREWEQAHEKSRGDVRPGPAETAEEAWKRLLRGRPEGGKP